MKLATTNETPSLDIPEGTHPATVLSVEETDGEYGPQLCFTYKLSELMRDDGNPYTLKQWASIKPLVEDGKMLHPGMKLYGIVSAVLYDGAEIPEGDELDTDECVGRRCVIWWGTEIQKGGANKGKQRTGILKVTAPPKPRRPAGQAQPVAARARQQEFEEEIDRA